MIKIFDTLSQRNVEWKLPSRVNWYTCGPTVYAPAHLGHARNYLVNDLIRRSLETFFNIEVNLCMNITDVDDKILNLITSNQDDMTEAQIKDITVRVEDEFWNDMSQINVVKPTHIIHVTSSMQLIIDYIQKIIDNGYAYEDDGSVYFDMNKYEEDHPEQDKFNRVLDTQDNSDFVLWKKGKGIWRSPWSIGRPGWHIECSAMSTSILGCDFDLHTGGVDLMFPHHQNEILQTQACQHARLCKYWMHVGHLHIDGQKMSKSLKNFITIQDALKQYSARAIRLCFMKHDWTKSMDFHDTTMDEILNIDNMIERYINWIPSSKQQQNFIDNEEHKKRIISLLENNFDFVAIISYIQETIKKRNIQPKYLLYLLHSFGLVYEDKHIDQNSIQLLVDFRTSIRDILKLKTTENKNKLLFDACDRLRDVDLKQLGIYIDDL
jgi:cysteinyl-tRNA synthetase